MYGDYGYMEEGQLGKAYNVRILRRLAHYAVPYKKMIAAALFLTIMRKPLVFQFQRENRSIFALDVKSQVTSFVFYN